MIEEIKLLLGEAAANFTEAQMSLAYRMAAADVEAYTRRKAESDVVLELTAARMAVVRLNRINTEGLASQSFSGVSESYIDGYPADIINILDSKRKIKVV